MRIHYIIIFVVISNLCFAQGTWVQKANIPTIGRELPSSFAIGCKGYVGCGRNVSTFLNDLWEWDQPTNVWTQKANYPGGGVFGAVGFSIGNYGYFGTGDSSWTASAEFWQYDPVANVWAQMANYGGGAHEYAVGFAIGTQGYIVSGLDNGFGLRGDVWEWDQGTNVWTQKDSIPVPRYVAVGFSINTKGYVSCGNGTGYLNDMWEFDPVANTWTQKTNLPAAARVDATGFSLCGKGYVGTKGECPCLSDLWQFDPVLNTWTQEANIPGPPMDDAASFTIGNKGYIAFGDSTSGLCTTLYEFTPDSNSSCSPLSCSACVLSANFISSDTAFCSEAGKCISFTDLSICNPISWHWRFPGATPDTSNQQNPDSICYYFPGTYPVTLIVSNAGGSDSLTVNPLIIFGNLPPPPTINVFGGDTLISSHGSYYQWYFNGSLLGGATDSFYIAHQGGTYSVQVTDSLGCNSLSSGVFVSGVLSLTFGEGLGVRLYPNPASDELTVAFDSPSDKDIEIVISTIIGQELDREILNGSKATHSIALKDFANGIYLLTLHLKNQNINRKFVVVHK